MRVAIVPLLPDHAGIGVATHLREVVAGLQARGHAVTRPASAGGDHRARVAEFGRLWAGEGRPDAVLVELPDADGQAAAGAAGALGIPLVTSFHDLPAAAAADARERVWRQVLAFHRRGRATVVKTAEIGARLQAAGIAPVFVRGAGIDRARFHPGRRNAAVRARLGAAGDAPLVLTVGRLLARKNPGLLAEAFAAVRAAVPGACAVVVGDDADGAGGAAIRAGLQAALPWVGFTGRVVGDALADIYAAADLFVLPSQTEVWPNVLFEAAASGVACVAFDRGDRLPMARIPLGDHTAFIAEAVRLAGDPAARAGVAAADLAAAAGHEWARVAERVEAALLAACAAPVARVQVEQAAEEAEGAPVVLAAWTPGGVLVVQPQAPVAAEERAAPSAGAAVGPLDIYLIDGVVGDARAGVGALARRLRAGLTARGHRVAGEAGAAIPTGGRAEGAAWREAQARRLRQAWSDARPDVVHGEMMSAFTLLAQEVAAGLGIPFTSAWHMQAAFGADAAERARLEQIALGFHRRSALCFVPTAPAARALAIQWVATVVTPFGVDHARFAPARRDEALRARWGADAGRAVVLYAGRLIAEKDPALLAAAMQAARAAGAATVIAGEGPAREQLERALPGTVFTGRIEGDALAAVFASAEVFVHPGVLDMIASAELEAMASGLALVAFARPHGDAIHRDGVTGIAVPMGDRAGFARAAAALAGDVERARAFGRAACAACAPRSWSAWLDAVEAGWRTVAQRGGAHGRRERSRQR
jgi:glycosyltransferase involved in cell wall biosynthesis